MPLHIDYRPENFDEFVGNGKMIKSLQSVLNREDIPQAFLLSGPTGCGKTTLARIIASELKCDPQFDLIEINTADMRGIDSARSIIQMASYSPNGEARVIILDEVHMATKDFQNAILKLLEDTPPNNYIVLCTTDAQKLIPTIRNRCSTFEVNLLDDRDMKDLLWWILEGTFGGEIQEPHPFDTAIENIIETADGCPRQAIVILDQILDLEDEKEMLDMIDTIRIGETKEVIALCRALIQKGSWKKITPILKGIKEDPEKVRWAILGYMNTALLGGDNQAAVVISCFQEPFYNSGKAGLTLACYEAIG